MHIIFEDNHCLAVVKPAALLTQGVPPGIPTLEAMVKAYLKEKYHKAGNVYLGIPHRLDRPVSGVVVFARNTKAARRLAEQFQLRQVTKIYWAAVEGDVQPAEGDWHDWLRKLQEESRSERAEPGSPGAAGGSVALPSPGTLRRRHPARTPTANRPHASAAAANCSTRLAHPGRPTLWRKAELRSTRRTATRPHHRAACMQPDFLAPDPLRAYHRGRGSSRGLAGTWTRLAGLTR